MSDLSNLFKISQPYLSANTSPAKTTLSSRMGDFRSSPATTTKDIWNIGELESTLKKGIKKQFDSGTMREEIQIFYKHQKKLTYQKLGIIGLASLVIFLASKIDGPIIFSLILMIFTRLLPSQILPINEEQIIKKSLKLIYPLIYCSVFYSVLKWSMNISDRSIDWNFSFIAIIAAIINAVTLFYLPIFTLSSKQNIMKAAQQKKFSKKLNRFSLHLFGKMKYLYEIKTNLICASLISIAGAVLTMKYFHIFTLEIFKPQYFIISFAIYFALQVYQEFVTYISLVYVSPMNQIKDKMPVFLSLLRLQNKPLNRLIQRQSIKSLYLKVMQKSCFLSTQTCKSLLYSTYMDMFNQYALLEMERINSAMVSFLNISKKNDFVVNDNKPLYVDLFVYFKQLFARVSSEKECIKFLESVSELNFLFTVIENVEKQAKMENESIRVSPRIHDIFSSLIDRLQECSTRVSLTKELRQQLIVYLHKISKEHFWNTNE